MATDNNTQIREDQNNLPANLLVLPLTTKPLFPGMFAPLFISRREGHGHGESGAFQRRHLRCHS